MYPSPARTRSHSSRRSSTSRVSPCSASLTRGAETRGSPMSGASAAVTMAAGASSAPGISSTFSTSPSSLARRRNASRASALDVTPARPLGNNDTSNTPSRLSGTHLRRMSSTARSTLSMANEDDAERNQRNERPRCVSMDLLSLEHTLVLSEEVSDAGENGAPHCRARGRVQHELGQRHAVQARRNRDEVADDREQTPDQRADLAVLGEESL